MVIAASGVLYPVWSRMYPLLELLLFFARARIHTNEQINRNTHPEPHQVRSTLDPLLEQLAASCIDDADLSTRLRGLFEVTRAAAMVPAL